MTYYDTKTRALGIRVTSNGTKSFVFYKKVDGRPERVTLGRCPDLKMEQARGMVSAIVAVVVRLPSILPTKPESE